MTDQDTQEKTLTLEDENKLIAQRREKLAALRENGTAYPNDFRRDSLAGGLHELYGDKTTEELDAMQVRVSVAGRMMAELIDACEKGLDHDKEPFQFKLRHIGRVLNVGFFSRNREINYDSSFSVNG